MVHSGEYFSATTAAATYHWSLLKDTPEGGDYLINQLVISLRRILRRIPSSAEMADFLVVRNALAFFC